jgi:hypothetical protein
MQEMPMNTQPKESRDRPAKFPGKTVAFQEAIESPAASAVSAGASLETKSESLGDSQAPIDEGTNAVSQALIQCYKG